MCLTTAGPLSPQCLKQQTPRQVDLSLEALTQKFSHRQQQYEEAVAREREGEQER